MGITGSKRSRLIWLYTIQLH